MIASAEFYIKPTSNEGINFNMGSLFHGFLMNLIDKEFASSLHNSGLKPYSQCIFYNRNEGTWKWRVSTINKEAAEKVLKPLCTPAFNKVKLLKKNIDIDITEKKLKPVMSYKDLADMYYAGRDFSRVIKLRFLTPTSFKSGEEYMLFPQISNIYKSLVNKWNTYSDVIALDDSDALEHLIQHTKMVGYNLRSTSFHLEGVRIQSFIGSIKLYISGPEILVRLSNMLFDFGSYSGIGIKASLGMGGITVE